MLIWAEEEKNAISSPTGWTDNKPWLRLYSALYDERTRPYLVSNNEVMTRQELDARNNVARPKTLYEFIADLVNDEKVVYRVNARPELHPAFSEDFVLTSECMPGPITAEEVKRRLADARAKLMKVISKWELSGNGFGQRAITDAQFGHMEEEQLEDGDNRATYLDGIGKEHLLILWQFGDQDGVLQTFLNKLSKAVAVDCDNIHTDTSAVQHRRQMTEEQQRSIAFQNSVAESMATMSYAAMMQELRESEFQAFRCKELAFTTTNTEAAEFYHDSYDRAMENVATIKAKIAEVDEMRRAKKQRNN